MDAAHVGKAGEALKRMVITVKKCIYTPGGAYDGDDMLLRVCTSDLEMKKMARVVKGSCGTIYRWLCQKWACRKQLL